jgi:hypothetical protein
MLSASEKRSPQVYKSRTVEPKRLNRCSPLGRQTDDPCKVVTPDEMLAPSVAPWMKERNDLTTHGIDRVRLGVLMIVAALTGECQIVQALVSPSLRRDDVLDGEGVSGEAFLTAAVLAKPMGTGLDPIPPPARALFRHSAKAGSPTRPSRHRAVCP